MSDWGLLDTAIDYNTFLQKVFSQWWFSENMNFLYYIYFYYSHYLLWEAEDFEFPNCYLTFLN